MSYERLEVDKVAQEFFKIALEVIKHLPIGHADLADQLNRAAQSCMQNIGEGAGKWTPADCRKYFDYARGGAMECGVHLDICSVANWRTESLLTSASATRARSGHADPPWAKPGAPPTPTTVYADD